MNPFKNKAWALLGAFFLGACGAGTKMALRKDAYDTIKTVAVIGYTVPDSIVYRENPREVPKPSLLKAIVQAVSSVDSAKAATLAHASFSEALNAQGLSFRVLTPEEMRVNPAFASLAPEAAPAAPAAEEPKTGMKKLGSLMGKMVAPKETSGVAPEGLSAFGVAKGWPKGSALIGKPEEKKYIVDAARALGVDAVLVVNDPGFSLSCTACAGAAGNMNGAGSTGSAFMAALVDKNGETVMEVSEWFATSGTSAVMAMSSVNPLEHEKLFKAHGEKMAVVFGDFVKKNLNTKN